MISEDTIQPDPLTTEFHARKISRTDISAAPLNTSRIILEDCQSDNWEAIGTEMTKLTQLKTL